MLTTVPLTLSGLRAACGEPTMPLESCAACSQRPASSGQHEEVPSETAGLVPFIGEHRGAARGYFYDAENLPMYVRTGEILRCPTCARLYYFEHEREYMDSHAYGADPPEDRYSYERLDVDQLFHSSWFATIRMDADARFGDRDCRFWVLEQRYFPHHTFARVQRAGVMQTYVLPEEGPPVLVDAPTLTGVIGSDPPTFHGREVDYAHFVDIVTSEYCYQYLPVDAFDAIPWRENLTDAERAQIEELRSASPVEPRHVSHTPEAVVIRRWIVAHQKLICRLTTVRPTGEVTREDAIVGENLPTHLGTQWKYHFMRNRMEPIA